MKTIKRLLFVQNIWVNAIVACAASQKAAEPFVYCNPLNIEAADPFVWHEGGAYYLYGTGTAHNGFGVHKSPDLIHWAAGPVIYQKDVNSWGQGSFWAPELMKQRGAYYLFFSTQHEKNGDRNITVAKGRTPEGPFTEYQGRLIPDGSFIDGHPFRDPKTGEVYFYAAGEGRTPNGIYAGKLSPDLKGFATTFTRCMEVSQEWEHNWIEAPFIVPHNGLYYMMYSGCAYFDPRYAVGYAVADNPLGPWRKYEKNPILAKTDEVSGPGHHSVVMDEGTSTGWIIYHRHRSYEDKHRVLAIDRMRFVAGGDGAPDRIELLGAPSCTTQTVTLGGR